MGHLHVWLKEPPDGRTSDDKYGDMRDMAHNSFWTSKEELLRLRLLVLILCRLQGGQVGSVRGDQGA